MSEAGELVDATGAALIDTPVSGSVSLVEQGALTVMAGGEAGVIAKAQPVLDVLLPGSSMWDLAARGQPSSWP